MIGLEIIGLGVIANLMSEGFKKSNLLQRNQNQKNF